MSNAIAASGRAMVLSVCEWGDHDPWLWAGQYGHLWRTTGDIINCWDCTVSHGSWSSSGVLPILDQQAKLRRYGGPDGWNDPDMMEVGNLPKLAENRSHFAMWAMLAAWLAVPRSFASSVVANFRNASSADIEPRCVDSANEPVLPSSDSASDNAGSSTLSLVNWRRRS